MLLSDLFETPQTDISTGQMASDAYRLFSDYVQRSNKYKFSIKNGFVFDCKDFDFDNKFGINDLCIIMKMVDPLTKKITGSYDRFSSSWMGFNHAIVLNCMKDLNEENIIKSFSSIKIMTVFKHEFIHCYDSMRLKGKEPKNYFTTNDDGKITIDKERYYNDPHEFNAYYHTVADNLINAEHELDSGYRKEDFSDILNIYGINGDFDDYVKNNIRSDSGTMNFFKNSNEYTRKKFLKRLYKLYAHVCNKAGIKIT